MAQRQGTGCSTFAACRGAAWRCGVCSMPRDTHPSEQRKDQPVPPTSTEVAS